MNGINVTQHETFVSLANQLRDVLGRDWVEEQAEQLKRARQVDLTFEGFDLIDYFGKVDQWATALREGHEPTDAHGLIRFAMIAWVVVETIKLKNGAALVDGLRAAARAGQIEQFYNSLFEAEAALYFRDQLHAQDIEFGTVKGGNPDFWAIMAFGGRRMRVPVECKRIQSSGQAERNLHTLALALDGRLQRIIVDHFPAKVIVWLHRPVKSSDWEEIDGEIRSLCSAIGQFDELGWRTSFHAEGEYQVSVARLGRAAEFQQPGPQIVDVPARPVLIPRAEARVISDTETVSRVKSVLSVRSDHLPNRIGNLQHNLKKAVQQLVNTNSEAGGCIAIRIRHPQALGDLYEADRLIRSELGRDSSAGVALVVLFWDEESRQKPDEADWSQDTSTVVARALVPYFITNPRCKLRFDAIDSKTQYFTAEPDALVRDHATGALIRVDADALAAAMEGADLTEELQQAVNDLGELNEDEDAVILYLRFPEPLQIKGDDTLSGVVRAGRRQFRAFITHELELKVIEIRRGQVVAVATVDLRAWLGCEELCYSIKWTSNSFVIQMVAGGAQGRSTAISSFVRPAAY